MLRGFGIAGFLIAFYVFAMGLRYAFEFRRFKPIGLLNHVIITGLLISVFVSALVSSHPTVLGGITAYYLAHLLGLKLGAVGIYLLLIGCAALYIIATFKVSQLKFPSRTAAPVVLQDDAGDGVMAEDEESIQTVSFDQEESIPEPVIKTELVKNEPEEELNIELAPQTETSEVLVSNDPTQKTDEFDVKVEVHKEEEGDQKRDQSEGQGFWRV
jgi:hypothetical protein